MSLVEQLYKVLKIKVIFDLRQYLGNASDSKRKQIFFLFEYLSIWSPVLLILFDKSNKLVIKVNMMRRNSMRDGGPSGYSGGPGMRDQSDGFGPGRRGPEGPGDFGQQMGGPQMGGPGGMAGPGMGGPGMGGPGMGGPGMGGPGMGPGGMSGPGQHGYGGPPQREGYGGHPGYGQGQMEPDGGFGAPPMRRSSQGRPGMGDQGESSRGQMS